MADEQKVKENLAVAGFVCKYFAKGIGKFLLKAVLAVVFACIGAVIGFAGSSHVGGGAQLLFFCLGGWAGWALGKWILGLFSKKSSYFDVLLYFYSCIVRPFFVS